MRFFDSGERKEQESACRTDVGLCAETTYAITLISPRICPTWKYQSEMTKYGQPDLVGIEDRVYG